MQVCVCDFVHRLLHVQENTQFATCLEKEVLAHARVGGVRLAVRSPVRDRSSRRVMKHSVLDAELCARRAEAVTVVQAAVSCQQQQRQLQHQQQQQQFYH